MRMRMLKIVTWTFVLKYRFSLGMKKVYIDRERKYFKVFDMHISGRNQFEYIF